VFPNPVHSDGRQLSYVLSCGLFPEKFLSNILNFQMSYIPESGYVFNEIPLPSFEESTLPQILRKGAPLTYM
jgi:hypothetical protein